MAIKTLNGYTFDADHPIGEGGMGCVYKARNSSGRIIALKMLQAKNASIPAFRTFFESEAKAISKLNHPNVVRIDGQPFSDSGGNLYLPMQFVDGLTLEKTISFTKAPSGHMMSEKQAVDIMSKVLETFEYIHAKGVIHRDIKPSNIMICPDNSICVIDFGIARDVRCPTGLTVGMTVGTDGYMSPEQVDGLNIDHRTDIYSLGCLLYYMMTGEHAIKKRSNDYETQIAILHDDFPRPSALRPDISPKLESVILKATDKNMTRRYSSAGEFRRALCNDTVPLGATITVGRAADNDICIPNDYVSGHHLIISYNLISSRHVLSIEDQSRNGTGIETDSSLLFLKHQSYNLDFNISKDPISSLPQVNIAGREEINLDWDKVVESLKSILKIQPEKHPEPEKPISEPTPKPFPWTLLFGILCVVLLIVVIFLII